MSPAQLEQVLLVQARELAAQREQIVALEAQVKSLTLRSTSLERHFKDLQDDRVQYRRGYQAGWTAGRRERAVDDLQRVTKAAVNA